MHEEFDKILSKKIKDTIETNKVSYNPEHWELLKTKQNKKKRRAFIWWRIAAIMVLGALIGMFVPYFTNSEINTIKYKNKVIDANSVKDSVNEIIKNEDVKLTDVEPNTKIIENENNYETPSVFKKKHIRTTIREFNTTSNVNSNKLAQVIHLQTNKSALSELQQLKNQQNSKQFFINIEPLLAKLKTNELNELDKLIATEKETNEKAADKNKVRLGFLVSSMKNIDNQYSNESAGFSSGLAFEIPISKNFEIYTGAVYSNQNFNIFNQNPNFIENASAKGNNIILKSRVASVQSIEFPVNLKYNFKLNSKKLFLSAGISSTQYFNEEIEATYLVNNRIKTEGIDEFGNHFVQYELTQQKSVSDTEVNSNSFELFSTLIFSVGISIPVNSGKQELIVEPFLKQSLSSLTSQKVNFSNAGIQLRYNFSLKK